MKKSRLALTLLPALVLGVALGWWAKLNVQASDPAQAEFDESTWTIKNFKTGVSLSDIKEWGHDRMKFARDIKRVGRGMREYGSDTVGPWSGACSGMNMAVMANILLRRRDPDAPHLRDVSSRLGEDQAKALAARVASRYARSVEKIPREKLSPGTALERLVKGTRDFQVLDVWSEGGEQKIGHQVLLLNKPPVRQGDDFRFEIYDANSYNPKDGTRIKVYFHYDAGRGVFSFEAEGVAGDPYRKNHFDTLYLLQVTEDDELIRELWELFNDAADGTLDGRVGSAGSPGGVALKTAVRPPAGFALKRLGLTAEGRAYASDGERSFEVGVDPSVLAVALQGVVLLEQPPWLSIGSEPSGEAGKMRVSYGGYIKDTPLGRALLDADLKLKGMSVGAGLGPQGSAAPRVQNFLWTFPQPVASSVLRLWIVGSVVVIDASDGRLTPRSHGLKLRYELALRGRSTGDEELERFVSQFNDRWGDIAGAVPELKRLEEAAFATALAQWVRESGAEVDEALLAYPFGREPTPEYVPAMFAASANGPVGTEGGIDLSGDPPTLGLGGLAGAGLASTLSNAYGHSPAWSALWVSLSLLLSLLPVPWVARLYARRQQTMSRSARWWKAFALWAGGLAALALIYLATSEFLFPLLGDFDAEFLSVILVLVAPAYVVRTVLVRAAGELSGGFRWAGSAALGLFTFLALSALLVAGQAVIVSAAEGKLTPTSASACRALSSPLNVALRPLLSLTLFDHLSGQAASVQRSTFWRFELQGREQGADGIQSELELPSLFGLTGPPGTPVRYYLIPRGGGPFVSRGPVYTSDPDRKPPY